MPTKKQLEETINSLNAQLEIERERPLGSTISNCSINMARDETKIAIAKAVKEGMKALQSLDGDSYGVYIGGNK